MTLGEQLNLNLVRIEHAARAAEEALEAARHAKLYKERQLRHHLVDDIRTHIIDAITQGEVPHYKVKNYMLQEWVRSAMQKKTGEYQDIWEGLLDWAHEQELQITTNEGHDGMGMESWLLIGAKPI